MDGNFVLLSCIHILVDVLNEPAGARLPPTLSPGYAPGPFLLTARASIAMTTLELPAKSVLCTPGNPIATTLQIDRAVFNKSSTERRPEQRFPINGRGESVFGPLFERL